MPSLLEGEELRPLVKWVGGKRRLAPEILRRLPTFSGTYWEPFCGGASVFCALYAGGRLRRSVLADLNPALLALLREVQQHPRALIFALRYVQVRYESESKQALYYRQRGHWNGGFQAPEHFVFLKQSSFNGLWRVNADGHMNAPWGKYESLSLPDADLIWAWHRALKAVDLREGSYVDTCRPKPGDLVYVDPPYVDTFGAYTSDGFSLDDQRDLLKRLAGWHQKGIHVAYSNSLAAGPLVADIWPRGTVHKVTTSYAVNRDGAGRKPVEELLVVGGP